MRRNTTTHLTAFNRSNATFDLSTPNVTTITLPAGSDWTSGPHWHEKHTEYLSILSGSAWVSLHGVATIVTAGSPNSTIEVPRGAIHEWRRATTQDIATSKASSSDFQLDIPLVVREWTDPADGQKEVFFRNLNSIILDTMVPGQVKWWSEYWLIWQLWVLFWYCDNWPVLLEEKRPKVLQWAVAKSVLVAAVFLGRCFGVSGVYKEYTPQEGLKKNL